MINFAVIGTNWISERFVNATLIENQLNLYAVYSRNKQKAQHFARKYKTQYCYDDLQQLSRNTEVKAVYIASPNSFHFEQTLLMLKSKKHVICEKPLASNGQQVALLYQTAKENNVILFEAYMTAYLPNFSQIKNNIARLGPLRKIQLNFCQYSSRYQQYLDGDNPNTFNPNFSSGSLMDIGYYCVAFAITLFGKPHNIQASAILLDSGVDGCGSVLLNYGEFSVTIEHSKISNAILGSEIQGEKGNIIFKQVNTCDQVHLYNPEISELTLFQNENIMFYEVGIFVQQIEAGKMDEKSVQRSQQVADVMTAIRKLTDVRYPSDE